MKNEMRKLETQIQIQNQRQCQSSQGDGLTLEGSSQTQSEGWDIAMSGESSTADAKGRGLLESEMSLDGEVSMASQAEEWGAMAITQELRHECYRLTRALGDFIQARYPAASETPAADSELDSTQQVQPSRRPLPSSPPDYYDMMTLLEACDTCGCCSVSTDLPMGLACLSTCFNTLILKHDIV